MEANSLVLMEFRLEEAGYATNFIRRAMITCFTPKRKGRNVEDPYARAGSVLYTYSSVTSLLGQTLSLLCQSNKNRKV